MCAGGFDVDIESVSDKEKTTEYSLFEDADALGTGKTWTVKIYSNREPWDVRHEVQKHPIRLLPPNPQNWRPPLPECAEIRGACEEAVTAVTAVTHEGKEVTATIPVTASGQKAVTQLPRRENAKGYEVTAVTAMPGKEQKAPLEAANDEPSEDIGPLVYPGDWLRHSPDNPLPPWASVNPEAHCELCGEAVGTDPHWFISRTDFGRVRCLCCQEAKWWAQGFELEDGFPYGDWQASAEERIADRDRAALQEWGRWLKTPDRQALLREANTQWWEALQPQERLIAKQAQQDRLIAEAKNLFNADPLNKGH
jgi:hypothetical protein